MLQKLIKSNEFITFLIIVLLSIIIGLFNRAFFSLATVFDVLRASIVYSILAFGVLLVIISGGVDISFVAIAALSAYATHIILLRLGYQGGILLYYVIGCSIGLLAGSLSGFIVTRFNLPVFDVSIAMSTLWYGFSRFFIGSNKNFELPAGTAKYYSEFILKVKDPFVGQSGLHVSVLYVLVIGVFVWWLLKYTTFGRGIYAIGGNREVAVRSGFNVKFIMMLIFVIMGVLSAFGGITMGLLSRHFDPTFFMANALDVIAAVILGGASINGGSGSVIGTFMGVILVQLINRAMVLTGISVEWQEFVVGVVLIVFISIPAIRRFWGNMRKRLRKPTPNQFSLD